MINRELIRLKVVQVTYAYYENEGRTIDDCEQELLRSLADAYYLYNLLLLLLVDLRRLELQNIEARRLRAERLGEPEDVSRRFVDNQLLVQLSDNASLLAFHDSLRKDKLATTALKNFEWSDKEDLVARLLAAVKATDDYKSYMSAPEAPTYEQDRDFLRRVYRAVLTDSDELSRELEDLSVYWNDDKAIVDTFVLKTLRRFEAASGPDQPLLPAYDYPDDRDFALQLLRASLTREQELRQRIDQSAHGWNIERMPLMDVVILQTALAETATFLNIPLGVTITEYVEIAKMYSTPRSGKYINAMLDNIGKELQPPRPPKGGRA